MTAMDTSPDTSRAHIRTYTARTRRPLTAWPLIGDGPSRVIPGGAVVTITENTNTVREGHPPGATVRTATAYLGGDPYECEIAPDQYSPHH